MVDLSFVPYFAPILAYLLVFLVIVAVLVKTKILGDYKWLAVFVGLAMATLFIAAGGVVDYVLTITPWIAALVISLFFVLMLTGFLGMKEDSKFVSRVGMGAVIIAALIFLISGFVVYSSVISEYVPFSDSYIGNDTSDLLFSPRVVGAVLLLGVAGLVSWVVVKAK